MWVNRLVCSYRFIGLQSHGASELLVSGAAEIEIGLLHGFSICLCFIWDPMATHIASSQPYKSVKLRFHYRNRPDVVRGGRAGCFPIIALERLDFPIELPATH